MNTDATVTNFASGISFPVSVEVEREGSLYYR